MYRYDQLDSTPCPASKRRAQAVFAHESGNENHCLVHDPSSCDATYNPSIVLSTPSRHARPLSSSPPGPSTDQSVLYSPWCPGTAPIVAGLKSTAPTPYNDLQTETAPLLALGVTLGHGRWEVGRVSGMGSTWADPGDRSSLDADVHSGSSSEPQQWSSPATIAWHVSSGYLPVCNPLSDGVRNGTTPRDAIDALDNISNASSSSGTHSATHSKSSAIDLGIDFEPRYIDYPPAPRLALFEYMEDPLDVPESDEFDFAYIPGYGSTCPDWTHGCIESPEGLGSNGTPGGQSEAGAGGLRSPWYCNGGAVCETRAFLLASHAEEGSLSKEGRVKMANDLAGENVCGLGLRI